MSNLFPANGYYLLDTWSSLDVTGDDATKFINGFCTNDIQKLSIEESCEAFFTDVKARILAYTHVFKKSDNSLTIVLSSSRANELLNHLDRYLIREAVELSLGKHAFIFTTSEPSDFVSKTIPLGYGTQIHLVDEGSKEAAVETLKSQAFEPLESTAFEYARISSGPILLDGVDVNEENLPQEVDRVEQTISFTKGCYLGQEPVARIDALGQVNWLLRKLVAPAGTLIKGENVLEEGKTQAKVKSVVNQSAGEDIALAYVRRQLANEGTEIIWNGNAVTVHKFPFEQTS